MLSQSSQKAISKRNILNVIDFTCKKWDNIQAFWDNIAAFWDDTTRIFYRAEGWDNAKPLMSSQNR